MEDVLDMLRHCEYSSENYEDDHFGECTPDEVQQSRYEYMYLRNLADYLETMMKSNKYSEKEMADRLQKHFDKMYSDFQKNSKKSIATKKKATYLKQCAFYSVYNVLEDALSL